MWKLQDLQMKERKDLQMDDAVHKHAGDVKLYKGTRDSSGVDPDDGNPRLPSRPGFPEHSSRLGFLTSKSADLPCFTSGVVRLRWKDQARLERMPAHRSRRATA